jgi:hypothetical protein
MAELTEEEIEFLERHHIDENDVFDGTGMENDDWKWYMKDGGYIVTIGVKPCREYGHTMRKHSGHCVMCDPARLEFARRHNRSGEIYIAFSETLELVKIGISQDSDIRVAKMNEQSYGGYDDWICVFSEWVDKAGVVESRAHDYLRDFRFDLTFRRGSIIETSREIFDCSIEDAEEAVQIGIEES